MAHLKQKKQVLIYFCGTGPSVSNIINVIFPFKPVA